MPSRRAAKEETVVEEVKLLTCLHVRGTQERGAKKSLYKYRALRIKRSRKREGRKT